MENVTKDYVGESQKRTIILFDNVYKRYPGDVIALKNFSCRIYAGEMVFFLGSSGAGKSTLIKLLLREESPTGGSIVVDGKILAKIRRGRIQAYRRTIGVVFQDFRLLSKKNVFQNVAFAMEIFGEPKHEIAKSVELALSLVGLEDKAHQFPDHLSGGEQQRVALARALVNKPKILLADEPTGNLDPENSEEIITLLKRINERGTTVLVASHEHEIVSHMNERIVFLDHGEQCRRSEEQLFYHSPLSGRVLSLEDDAESDEVDDDE